MQHYEKDISSILFKYFSNQSSKIASLTTKPKLNHQQKGICNIWNYLKFNPAQHNSHKSNQRDHSKKIDTFLIC